MSRQIVRLKLDTIDAERRERSVSRPRVEFLATSIEAAGQTTPIIVRAHPECEGRWLLVAGAHRLAAVRSLGWPEIDADVQSLDELAAKLVEIDENLARAELTVLDRARSLAARKIVYEALHPQARHGGDRRKTRKGKDDFKSPDLATCGFPRFSAASAAAIGLSERVVQRLVQIADALSDDVAAQLAAAPVADNQGALLALIEMDEATRALVLPALAEGRTLSAARKAAGLDAPKADPGETAMAKIIALFGALDRRSQLAVIDTLQKMARGEKLAPAKAAKPANAKPARKEAA